MTPSRTHNKKEPRYLEDVTYTVADSHPGAQEDLFTSGRFLGLYDENQIMDLLRKAGIIEILYGKGYRNLVINISKQDNYTSRLYVDSDSEEGETRLIELILREGVFRPKQTFLNGFDFQEGLSMLLVE